MRADRSVAALVTRARNGDKQAWDEFVERYAPLVWSICRRYQLSRPDADRVGQSIWPQLVDQLAGLPDPAALPGWLATTTERECRRLRRAARGAQALRQLPDAGDIADPRAAVAELELARADRDAALREALTQLPPPCQRLIAMLIDDPPAPDTEISAELGIPAASIGPHRARCLDKLRRCPAAAALINAEAPNTGRDPTGQPLLHG